jgi:hypothetical protein
MRAIRPKQAAEPCGRSSIAVAQVPFNPIVVPNRTIRMHRGLRVCSFRNSLKLVYIEFAQGIIDFAHLRETARKLT